MILRKGNRFDLNDVFNIEIMAHDRPYWSKNMLFEVLTNKTDKELWVYEIENDIIGFIIEMRCSDEISLLNVAIYRSLQGVGHGLKMLKKYIKTLPDKCSIYLEVNKNNIRALKMYTKLNFEIVYIRKSYYKDGSDAINLKLVK